MSASVRPAEDRKEARAISTFPVLKVLPVPLGVAVADEEAVAGGAVVYSRWVEADSTRTGLAGISRTRSEILHSMRRRIH